jgi:L-2-hydroxyglutarate oxidase LhgO
MPDTVDITIIGAGVIGLAIASEVTRKDREVYLLDKNPTFGQEQSSRSSEVIHAGIYYAPDSLKTRLCLEGNHLIYQLSRDFSVPCDRCGKIFIAANEGEVEVLEKLFEIGINNGLPLQMLSQAELRKLEPHVEAVGAFLSPTSGIMDSHALMKFYLGRARKNGVQAVFGSAVTGIEKTTEGYILRIENPSGEESINSKVVINCAGIYSDKVAGLAGIDINKAGYQLYYAKGEYYSVGGRNGGMINSLIYPVPQPLGPGIHVCLDLERRIRLGPLFYYVNDIDYRIDDSRKSVFEGSNIMKSLPFIKPGDLEPETTGVLAVRHKEGEPVLDFIISHEEDKGLPGLINLIGIDSPGLTASPAIAGYAARIVDEILN